MRRLSHPQCILFGSGRNEKDDKTVRWCEPIYLHPSNANIPGARRSGLASFISSRSIPVYPWSRRSGMSSWVCLDCDGNKMFFNISDAEERTILFDALLLVIFLLLHIVYEIYCDIWLRINSCQECERINSYCQIQDVSDQGIRRMSEAKGTLPQSWRNLRQTKPDISAYYSIRYEGISI